MNKIQTKSFTADYSGISDCLNTPCWICPACEADEPNPPPMKEFKALWDTGATVSVISGRVANLLGLLAIGRWTVHHANGSSEVNTYCINVLLPNDIDFHALRVSEGVLTGTDVLIGMDIISKGDFAVTTSLGKTMFSFQIPSTHEIDFTKD